MIVSYHNWVDNTWVAELDYVPSELDIANVRTTQMPALRFKKGETMILSEETNQQGWWKGQLLNAEGVPSVLGWIPANGERTWWKENKEREQLTYLSNALAHRRYNEHQVGDDGAWIETPNIFLEFADFCPVSPSQMFGLYQHALSVNFVTGDQSLSDFISSHRDFDGPLYYQIFSWKEHC